MSISDEPFGRQPQIVEVFITGKEPQDIEYWRREFMRRAEFKGDLVEPRGMAGFIIYPRAVND